MKGKIAVAVGDLYALQPYANPVQSDLERLRAWVPAADRGQVLPNRPAWSSWRNFNRERIRAGSSRRRSDSAAVPSDVIGVALSGYIAFFETGLGAYPHCRESFAAH